MSQSTAVLDITGLNRNQRVELLAQVWDNLLEPGATLPFPEWHLREIERRIARADAEPGTAIPLEQLRAELLGSVP